MYVRAWQGRHGLPARGRMGWRFERAATRSRTAVDDWRDAQAPGGGGRRGCAGCSWSATTPCGCIARFDGPDTALLHRPARTPPRRAGRGGRPHAYAHELTDDDHRRLAEALHALRGMAVVSGYPCPLYRELYAGWPAVTRRARTNGPRAATEALWLSPRAAARLGARQLSLLEEERA